MDCVDEDRGILELESQPATSAGANKRTLEEYPYRLQIFVISRPGPNLHFKPSNPSENLAFSPSTRPHRLRWPLTPWLMGVGRSPENKDPSPASPVKAEQPLPTSPEKSDRATDSPGKSERAAELAPEKRHRREMVGQIKSDSVKKGPAVWSSEKKGLSTASPGKSEGVSEETKDPSSSEKKRSPSPRREDRRKCRLGRSRRRREVAPLLRLENRRKWWSRQRKQ